MYHYVRPIRGSDLPEIKGLEVDAFRAQLDALAERFEWATLESALAYCAGRYTPARPLCLLTFDDGLKDHAEHVTPILAERGIQGVFFLISDALLGRFVAEVHQNHLIMATLPPPVWTGELRRSLGPSWLERADPRVVASTYRWDDPETGAWKYVINHLLPEEIRRPLLDELLRRFVGPPEEVARRWYCTPAEARAMQAAGMVLGGHSQRHAPLSRLSDEALARDLRACRDALRAHLTDQPRWPFSFPYGKPHTFDGRALDLLDTLGFDPLFTTEVGDNPPGTNPRALRRVDVREALAEGEIR